MIEGTSPSKEISLIDIAVISLIGAGIYLPFLGLHAWVGNETVRVIVAKEMARTGDWIIPILHGKPYFVKPPMMNWLIAASGSFFGTFNEWTTRAPSVLVSFLTSFSIYFLTSRWLDRTSRFFAAVASLTMVALIQKGTSAEIDSLFVFFVLLPLLLWINGHERQWKPGIVWGLSLLLVGIGFLTKGPQGPAYFYSTVFAYLFFRKRLSFFFSKSHLLGILIFALVIASYLSFVLERISIEDYAQMWVGQITQRAESRHYSFLEHFIQYPFRILLSFMPWTLFIFPAIAIKDLRKSVTVIMKNELILFSVIMFLVNFPLYWLLPNARVRYFLPAGPFSAIILAGFFGVYLKNAAEDPKIQSLFKKSVRIMCWLILLSAFLLPFVVYFLKLDFTPGIIVLLFCAVSLSIFILSRVNSFRLETVPLYLALMTGIAFLISTDLDVQREDRKGNSGRQIAHEINLLLPDDVHTVFEIGYRRFLTVSCYIKKDVIQIDDFSQLKSLKKGNDKVYFLFDTDYLDSLNAGEKDILLHDMQWQKLYSKQFERARGDIVLGLIK